MPSQERSTKHTTRVNFLTHSVSQESEMNGQQSPWTGMEERGSPRPRARITTLQLGIATVNGFARDHGYGLTTRRSKRTKNGVSKTIRLCCEVRIPAG
ncbi:hypothetical protein N7497_003765 [Penicillium chrysogenum]|uniref:Uncharacterized protein n=1 Tax=Penicillium chrysogenum TaxID=5076 RepID=A0ABQ8WXQ3_PENCH|nr:hypothetical protein N7505_001456 [Penicillium chrysogenum]KAJ6163786.1 hypothetical protein N7497_003765 [Penicillium chrysogenum]